MFDACRDDATNRAAAHQRFPWIRYGLSGLGFRLVVKLAGVGRARSLKVQATKLITAL